MASLGEHGMNALGEFLPELPPLLFRSVGQRNDKCGAGPMRSQSAARETPGRNGSNSFKQRIPLVVAGVPVEIGEVVKLQEHERAAEYMPCIPHTCLEFSAEAAAVKQPGNAI